MQDSEVDAAVEVAVVETTAEDGMTITEDSGPTKHKNDLITCVEKRINCL